MAKNNPGIKQKHKDHQSLKSKYKLQFIFPGSGKNQISPEYIAEFASKIKNEFFSRIGICKLYKGDAPSSSEDSLIRHIALDQANRNNFNDLFKEGYAVLLENHPLEKQFNPNEFLRLPLPEDAHHKAFYEISFKGKKSTGQVGVIIPAKALSYILTIQRDKQDLEPGFVKMILQKLGFETQKITIQQDAPFEHRPSSITLTSQAQS